MILGKVRCGFFQELVLHPQFPRFAFKLPKPGPLTHAQRWLVTGMLTPISIDPVPQSALIDTELLGHLSDRTRCLDHQFHGLFPILGREVPLRTRQDFSFPDGPILVGSLSGKSGAPHPRVPGAVVWVPVLVWRVALSRYDLVPVWMMWALKVNRSTTAAASRGSVNVAPHSENGALDAHAMEAFSSRAVMIWNSSSAPRGSSLT